MLLLAVPCGLLAENPIVVENRLPGSPPTEWDVNGAGDLSLQGFARQQSYVAGEVVEIAVQTDSRDWQAHIYRLGYYGGAGARLVARASPIRDAARLGSACNFEPDTLLYDCGAWPTAVAWRSPPNATSGLYFARLVRFDAPSGGEESWRADGAVMDEATAALFGKGGRDERPQPVPHAYGALGFGKLRDELAQPRASHVWFVLREATPDDGIADDVGTADALDAQPARRARSLLFQTSDSTWQAYNRWGGSGLYGGKGVGHGWRDYGGGGLDRVQPSRRAYKVSYNRPLVTRDYRSVNMPLGAEYAAVRWLERNGYDVRYAAAFDVHRLGGRLLRRYGTFLSVGHDEYWSGPQRSAVERARAHGVHLVFMSGNEAFWRVRWERGGRTLVCFKETQADAKLDPAPAEWTGTFRDGRAINPLGAAPENALSGALFTANAWIHEAVEVPARMARLRPWRASALGERVRESTGRARLLRGSLGHEFDEDIPNGHRPRGLVRLSEATVDGVMYVQDGGALYDTGSATHRVVAFRDTGSGALTLGFGTVQWAWALDPHHDGASGVPPERANPLNTRVRADRDGPDAAAQQFTVNMLGEMGAHGATLEAGLVPASASTDVRAPVSCVRQRSAAALVVAAADADGAVAAVECSLDGGRSWLPAEPASSELMCDWLLRVPERAAAENATCVAVDDSFNLERAPTRDAAGGGPLAPSPDCDAGYDAGALSGYGDGATKLPAEASWARAPRDTADGEGADRPGDRDEL